MGGLIRSQNVRGDLWLVEGGTSNISAYPVVTTSEGPGPRVGHASLLVGNAFIGKYMPLFLSLEIKVMRADIIKFLVGTQRWTNKTY